MTDFSVIFKSNVYGLMYSWIMWYIHHIHRNILQHLIIHRWKLGGCKVKVKRKIKGINYSTRQSILSSYCPTKRELREEDLRWRLRQTWTRQVDERTNYGTTTFIFALIYIHIHSLGGRGWGDNKSKAGLGPARNGDRKNAIHLCIFSLQIDTRNICIIRSWLGV